MRPLWIALTVLATTLAGCSDDGGETVDAADLCDGILQADGTCTPHVEPSVVVEGLPATVAAYQNVAFTWRLDNGTRGTPDAPVHSMDSRLLVSVDDAPTTNMTGPDDWGTEVAREQHQNLPGSFEAAFSWDVPGTVYLRGYMLIEGQNVWTDLGSVQVTDALPTGVVKTVTIGQGPPPALDSAETGIVVGDAVAFKNDNAAYGYTAVFSCSDGYSVADLTVAAGATSDPVVFTTPTSCSYTLQTDLSGSGVSQGDLAGKVNVNRP